jgi:hypothetical protein
MYLLGDAWWYLGLNHVLRYYPDFYVSDKIPGRDTSINGTCSQFRTDLGLCNIGTVYFDRDCKAISNPTGTMCSSAIWGWRGSPISLVWNESAQGVSQELAIARFPIFSDSMKQWVNWKASKERPLLVRDPEHTGTITSAEQLFGSRSFGGKPGGGEWENGFEALATLDANRDGKIAGDELSPLALWFDENRDAVSQPGEVRPLSDPEVAVTALYFDDLKKDVTSGDVLASRGFERIVDGRAIPGASIDWFTEGGESKQDVINKLIATSAMNTKALPDQRVESVPTSTDTPSQPVASILRGLWLWETDDPKFKEHGSLKPQGYLTFSDSGDGKISGHSYVETPYSRLEATKSQLDIVRFDGKREKSDDGTVKISFEIAPDGASRKTVVSSTAVLHEETSTLHGRSDVAIIYNGEPSHLTYTWVARKVK